MEEISRFYKQPFEAISRIATYCQAKGIDFAIGGSWSLTLSGVLLDEAPHDLDIQIGLESLDEFYSDNPWIRQLEGEIKGRSIIPDDNYIVHIFPIRNTFQKDALQRAS